MSTVVTARPARAPRRERGATGNHRHLRVVAQPRPKGRRRLFTTVAFVVLFGVLLGTVAFHVRIVKDQQRIDRLDKKAQVAQDRYDRLRVEVDRLSAPERIVSHAEQLGMVRADNPVWLAPKAAATPRSPSRTDPSIQDYLDVKPYLGDTR